ncbi:MAG: hypothetical protein QOJ98_572 [Acidobacteriota bacterium]|jgi:hypothetical protein|nr:hypothetical protein [Acidobacteriota bacterium]
MHRVDQRLHAIEVVSGSRSHGAHELNDVALYNTKRFGRKLSSAA